MIFVSVGTHNQGFERLVKEADSLALKIEENIFIQKGCANYTPINCKYKNFLTQDEFNQRCKKSSLVITHGGIGSIMTPLLMGKKIIVVPRLKKFKEHTNDHQLQITKELATQRKILAVYDIKMLGQAIKISKSLKRFNHEKNRSTKIIDAIRSFIENYENRYSA